MIQYDPYSTSYGSILNTDKVKKELQKYLITTPLRNLNYEYITNKDIKLVIITGCVLEEKELPIWDMPLLIEDIKGNKHICVDLRKYVKTVDQQPLKVSEIFKDKSACTFILSAALFMADLAADEFAEYRKHFNTITLAYSFLISYLVDVVIKLNPVEKVETEIMIAYLANLMLSPSPKDEEYVPAIIARLSTAKFSLPVNKKTIENVVKLYVPNKVVTIKDLVNGIKMTLPQEKGDLITDGILINTMSNIWYGPGSNETLLMGAECMGIWMALVYSALSDQTYKRSRLATILDKFSRNLNSKDFVKAMDLVIENKIIK